MQTVTFEEAYTMLHFISDSILCNANWDRLSVRKYGEGFFIQGGVLNIAKERNASINFKNIEVIYEQDNLFLQVALPLIERPLVQTLSNFLNKEDLDLSKKISLRIEQIDALSEYKESEKITDYEVTKPVGMGDSIAHYAQRADAGRLGAYIESTSGQYFAITACHVVDNPSRSMHASVGDTITSPPVREDLKEKYEIGKLFHWVHKNNDDIALIWIKNTSRIRKKGNCNLTFDLMTEPNLDFGDTINICTTDGGKRSAKIKSPCCHKKCSHTGILMKNLVETGYMGSHADSGSIVYKIKDDNRRKAYALGLLIMAEGTRSNFFMNLDYLKGKHTETIEDEKIEFQFKSFV